MTADLHPSLGHNRANAMSTYATVKMSAGPAEWNAEEMEAGGDLCNSTMPDQTVPSQTVISNNP